MEFSLRKYRNHKDFKYGSFRLEMKTDGGYIIYGRLKRNSNESKYQEVFRVY